MLLGDTAKVTHALMNDLPGFNVDMYGSGVLVDENGLAVHAAYGMDNDYRCELEAWGSRGTLHAGRVFTAPAGFEPKIEVSGSGNREVITIPPDDAFEKSLLYFQKCICDAGARETGYRAVYRQAVLMDDFRRAAGRL